MVYLIGFALVASLGVALWWLQEKKTAPRRLEEREKERLRLERERDRTIATLLQEGSHLRLPTGAVVEKCALCETRATYPAVRFERSTSLWAWVRERLGAPRRYQVGFAKFDAPTLCEVHVHLVREHFQSKLSDLAQAHSRQMRDDELELQSFERGGALEELRALTQEQPRQRGKRKKASPPHLRVAGGNG